MQGDEILLTGASGFLGSMISIELEKNGVKVRTLGKSTGDYSCDLATTVPRFNIGFKYVIHAAGKAHVIPTDKEESKLFYDVNLKGTKNLLTGLEKINDLPESVIYISTVSVYGLGEGKMIKEETLLNGSSPYADSKKKAEEFLVNWGKENGVKIGILRLPLVVGPNPPGNLRAMIDGIKSGKYFSIRGNKAKKSMVKGKDIVSIIEPLAVRGGIYNLTDGCHPGVHELEDVISNSVGRKVKSIPKYVAKGVAKVGDVIGPRFPLNSDILKKLTSTLTFSDEKARKELGWNPSPVLEYLPEILK